MINKINKLLAVFFVICGFVSATVSCTDRWDDHYAPSTQSASQASLWTSIARNDQLSNFARVVQACGYDRVLGSDQTFTVFAPTNTSLTGAEADTLIASYNQQVRKGVPTVENTVVRRFLLNHIAQYRYPVSSLTDQTISLMNSKYVHITSDKLGDRNFMSKNSLCANGLLFTLDGKMDYVPNIFESLTIESGLDSVYNFLNSHSVYEFDESQSVPGEIIDGVTHYLDSVTVFHNNLLARYGLINSEDSSYIMVAPVNGLWDSLLTAYTPYFNYANRVENRDSMVYTNTRLAILSGAFFNRTDNSDAALQDSAVSTQAYSKLIRETLGIEENYYVFPHPYAEGGVFDGTTTMACSNGYLLKATKQNKPDTLTFMQTVKVEAEYNVDTLDKAIEPVGTILVASNNPFYSEVSGNAFIAAQPVNPDAKVAVGIRVPRLLSNMKYDIYAAFAPPTAADIRATEEASKTMRVVCRVCQTDQEGQMSSPPFRNAKTVDCSKVEEIKLVSKVKINTCGWDLNTPNVRFEIQSNTAGATLRIDYIKFVPVE